MHAALFNRRVAAALAGGALAAAALAGCGDSTEPAANENTPGPTLTSSTPSDAATTPTPGDTTATATPDEPAGTPTPEATQTLPATGPVLGPAGFGRLRLGQTSRAALASGVLRPSSMGPEECSGFNLARFPDEEDPSVFISKGRGVQAIYALGDMRTREGVRIGTKLAAVRKAYPGLRQVEPGEYSVPVPGNPAAAYTFLVGNELGVYELGLVAKGNVCS